MNILRASFACLALGLVAHGARGAPAEPPPEFFARLDADRDGRISLSEFYPTGPAPLHPRMKQVFEAIDKDHTGKLSFADTAQAIATVSGNLPKFAPDVEGDSRTVALDVHPRTKRPFIKVKINDVVGVFLFDTGTSDTIVHPKFAKRAGVDFVEICMPITGGNVGQRGEFVSLVRVPDLVIAETRFRNFHAVLLESKQPTYEFGEAIDGVLGANVIFAKPVTLDLAHGSFSYAPQKKDSDSIELPLLGGEKTASLEADIDGVKVPLLLDTGAAIGDAVLINAPHHEAFRKLAGNAQANTYTAKSILVAGHEIDTDVHCLLNPFERSLISAAFFHDHSITVDTAAGKVLLKRNP